MAASRRRRGRRRLYRCGPGRGAQDARSGPAPTGRGAAATGGRRGGERAAAHPDGDEPGGHVGQGHHDQRGGPGGRAGDVVRDAEGGDGRAGWSLTVLAGSGGYDRHHRPVHRFLYRCVARLAARLLPRGAAAGPRRRLAGHRDHHAHRPPLVRPGGRIPLRRGIVPAPGESSPGARQARPAAPWPSGTAKQSPRSR